ncbi:MAG: prepilin-type N-terminal cleavage/methylation domain-containing protein [Gemmatimonadales bacterium]|nr:MAG: prepilin-type N-terminal cleavage/methylation domain-containing protein [Gemmatimonadales bacterium]
MRMLKNRNGFTLVELLIVVVLGGLILAATFRVLVSNQQIYTAQSATVMGQQTVRGAVELLTSEIREMSTASDPFLGSDLIVMESDRIQMRVMRKVAVVCGVEDTDPLLVRAAIMGLDFAEGDSVLVHADGSEDASEHFWSKGEVISTPATGTPANCGGEPSLRLRIDGMIPGITSANQVASGSLVRSFQTVEYRAVALDGDIYLGRGLDGEPEPVIGPIAANDGLRFDYLDANGDPTTTPADVRTIQVTVRTVSRARGARGELIADSLSVFVNPRN